MLICYRVLSKKLRTKLHSLFLFSKIVIESILKVFRISFDVQHFAAHKLLKVNALFNRLLQHFLVQKVYPSKRQNANCTPGTKYFQMEKHYGTLKLLINQTFLY